MCIRDSKAEQDLFIEMAVKQQRGIVDTLEEVVAVFKTYLDAAEAEYKATIAKLLK